MKRFSVEVRKADGDKAEGELTASSHSAARDMVSKFWPGCTILRLEVEE